MNLKQFNIRLQFRKEFVIILLWTFLVSLVIIISYHSIYLTNVRWQTYKVAWDPIEGPMLNLWGVVALIILSFFAGYSLKNTKFFVFGFLLTLILSFVISVIFGFIYIWFGLGFSEDLGQIPFGWEWAFYMSLLNCFRIYVPHVLVLLILGSGFGHLIGGYYSP